MIKWYKMSLFLSILVLMNWSGWTKSSTPPVTKARESISRYAGDPIAVRSLNPVFDPYPDSSLVDFSYLLDLPAGKQGFVEVGPEGHFRFSNTKERVRFWGVTVAASHVDIEKSRIATVVDVIARAGCNVVRLHELDNRGGEKYNLVRRNIIDEAYPNDSISSEFDLEYRDRVDYWIACCQKRGIYVYLVVRGYRTFRPGDGVEGTESMERAGKPYAFFVPRLIELQKKYAGEWLFDHVNPYTRIPNGLNPAVCVLEVENEDSLFFHIPWKDLIEPHRTLLKKMWNEWLIKEYGTTEKLKEAWTDEPGHCALGEDEDIQEGTVKLPEMKTRSLQSLQQLPWSTSLDSPPRNADGTRFAMDVQQNYFDTMRDYFRSRGCKIPLTAVVNSNIVADTWTVARALDGLGENAYLDHPSFKAGEAWVGKSFFTNMNYIRKTGPWSLAPHMARYKWAGKPLICREWATCWPNEYRSSSALDIASHSLMQNYDMLIYFSYYTWGNPETIMPFGLQADPTQWGLFGYAGLLFTRGDLEPDSKHIALAYNNDDLATWASWFSPFQDLSWTHRMENWNPDESPLPDQEDALFTLVAGRSGKGSYQGKNLLLYDSTYQQRAEGSDASKKQGLLTTSGYDYPWIYSKGGFPVQEVLNAGFQPVSWEGAGVSYQAFYDPARNGLVLGPVSESDAALLASEFAERLKQGSLTMKDLKPQEKPVKTALNGKLVRDTDKGILKIATDRFCSIAGELESETVYESGDLELHSVSPIGAVILASLDGKPFSESRYFSIKMATVAHNRGQRLIPIDDPEAPTPFVLDNYGNAPVQTEGRPSDQPTQVSIGGKKYVEAFLKNGTWEVVFDLDRNRILVMCDTPNTRFIIHPEALGIEKDSTKVKMTKFYYEYPPVETNQESWDFIYPGFAKYIRLDIR